MSNGPIRRAGVPRRRGDSSHHRLGLRRQEPLLRAPSRRLAAAGRAPSAGPGANPAPPSGQERLGRGVAGGEEARLGDLPQPAAVGLEGHPVLGQGLGRVFDGQRLAVQTQTAARSPARPRSP